MQCLSFFNVVMFSQIWEGWLTFNFVTFSWIFFRANSLEKAYEIINHLSKVQVAVDSSLNYNDITLNDANTYSYFSNKKNIIGYNWKYFDFDTQTYTVKSYITYVIKNNSSEYYKMRFIDFYNEVGEKGFPKIEIQKL